MANCRLFKIRLRFLGKWRGFQKGEGFVRKGGGLTPLLTMILQVSGDAMVLKFYTGFVNSCV